MDTQKSPHKAHLFICKKTRSGTRKSCGNGSNPDLKVILKNEIKTRGWSSQIRVSESGCLGVCENGPNMMVYPQGIWFSDVTHNDVPEILQTLETLLET